jgi:SNF2 family DNA or RNA helicase
MDSSVEILKAAAALLEAGSCEDVDVPVLSSVLAEKAPTGRQVRCIWSVLGRYRDRLQGQGMDYGALVPPADGDGSTFEAHLKAKVEAYEASKTDKPAPGLEPSLKLPLYPFQQAAVQAIEDHQGRLLVADEMGLGKSAEVLGWLALHPEALPALVICPATIRVNWCREIAKFTPFKPHLMTSKTSLKAFRDIGVEAALGPQPGYQVIVMNYDILEAQTPRTWTKALIKGDKSVVPYLLQAGLYALNTLKMAYDKSKDIDAGIRILSVIGQIEQQPRPNRRRFVRVFVNGMPLADFLGFGFKTLIADESHYIKDMKAQRTLAVLEISRRVQHAI